jgi:hypothetical protein
MKHLKKFEKFEVRRGYVMEAEKLLDQIETLMGIQLSKDLFYEIINLGKIILKELKDILFKLSNLEIKEQIIFINILTKLYPEIRESEEFKDIFHSYLLDWRSKLKSTPDDNEVKQPDFSEKLKSLKTIIIKNFSNLRNSILSDTEWESDYDTRQYADIYNL